MKKTIVLIDNGHGAETPGKCSPDGTHREWAWSRRMAAELKRRLEERGVEAHLLVPENGDVALRERVLRANEIARRRKALLRYTTMPPATGRPGTTRRAGARLWRQTRRQHRAHLPPS